MFRCQGIVLSRPCFVVRVSILSNVSLSGYRSFNVSLSGYRSLKCFVALNFLSNSFLVILKCWAIGPATIYPSDQVSECFYFF